MELDQDSLALRVSFEGRVALVTGAGSGFGEAIARAFAQAGAHVVLVARTETQLRAVETSIREAGGRCDVACCDVTDDKAVTTAIDALERLDVLVNNAGVNIPEPFLDVPAENLDAMWRLNTRAPFVVSQAAVRKMLEDPQRRSKGGAILNISSQMGHVGATGRTGYCMSKHGLEGFSKALALELAPFGIRVNTIAPTFADTPLVRRIVGGPAEQASTAARIPLGRLCRVEEIAAAALFLASDLAGSTTGTHLLIDGGWTAQ